MGDYRRYDDENIQMGSKYVLFDFLQAAETLSLSLLETSLKESAVVSSERTVRC